MTFGWFNFSIAENDYFFDATPPSALPLTPTPYSLSEPGRPLPPASQANSLRPERLPLRLERARRYPVQLDRNRLRSDNPLRHLRRPLQPRPVWPLPALPLPPPLSLLPLSLQQQPQLLPPPLHLRLSKPRYSQFSPELPHRPPSVHVSRNARFENPDPRRQRLFWRDSGELRPVPATGDSGFGQQPSHRHNPCFPR